MKTGKCVSQAEYEVEQEYRTVPVMRKVEKYKYLEDCLQE